VGAGRRSQPDAGKAIHARPGKTRNQVTLRNKPHVSPRPLAEEFTLLTEQMDIVEAPSLSI